MAVSEKKSALHRFFILLVLSFLLLVLDRFGKLSWLKSLVAEIGNPAKAGIYNLYQASKKIGGVSNKGQTLQDKLQQQEIELQGLRAKIAELEQENEAIRKLLGAPLPASWQFLPAKITGYKNGEIFINQGENQGISVGQAALFEEAYVGKVVEAAEKSARVRSLFHKDLNLPVRIAGEAISGRLRLFNGQVIVDEIDRDFPRGNDDKNLKVGDILVTQGHEEMPAGILVGEIKSLIDDPTAPFQKALVEPAVDVKELVNVFIVME